MELRDLEYLLACVDAGTFTRAARAVHAAQPTLSHAIKRLEDELGQTLLHRPDARGERVVPTEAGALVVETARVVTAQLAALRESVEALDGVLRGGLQLGAAPSIAASLVPALLRALAEAAPLVRASVATAGSDELVERVRDGSLELALVADVPRSARRGLVTVPLYEEPFVIVAGGVLPLGRSASLKTIARGPLLLPPEQVFHGRAIRDAFARAGAGSPTPAFVLGSADALIAAAEAGLGYALLPSRSLGGTRESLRVATIRGARVAREVLLVAHPTASKRRAVAALIELLPEVAREHASPCA